MQNAVEYIKLTSLDEILTELNDNNLVSICYSAKFIPTINYNNYDNFNYPLWITKMLNLYDVDYKWLFKSLLLSINLSGFYENIKFKNEYKVDADSIINISHMKKLMEYIIRELEYSNLKNIKNLFTENQQKEWIAFSDLLLKSIEIIDDILKLDSNYGIYKGSMSYEEVSMIYRTILTINQLYILYTNEESIIVKLIGINNHIKSITNYQQFIEYDGGKPYEII